MARTRAGAMLLAITLGLPASGGDGDAPAFTDVTAGAGLAGVPVFRVSVADLNGDGYPDLLLHRKPDEMAGDVVDKQFLYLNEPDPSSPVGRRFVDRTSGSGIRDNRAGTAAGRHSSAAIFADVDADGDLDMFTGVYHHRNFTLDKGRNDLLLNDGSAHFSLSPASAFHLDPIYNTAAEAFLDYDLDGDVDLFLGNWYCPPAGSGSWCVAGFGTDGLTHDQLYRNNADGTFTNVTAAAGLTANATVVYGIAVFDADDDGWPDLFAPPYSHTSIYSAPRHWRNNGNGTYSQVQASSSYDDHRGFGSNVASFGSMPADYDNDGWVDFCEVLTHGGSDTGKYSGPVRNAAGVFSWDWSRVVGRSTEDPNVAHDGDHHAAWLDYDGDGRLDYAITESGYGNDGLYLFRQGADGKFTPATDGSGLDEVNTGAHVPGNVVPADVDLDGDEDLLVGLDDVGIRVYRNDVGNLSRWLTVRLEGIGAPGYANRSAIGAKIQVIAGGVTQTRVVDAGNGHQGPQRPLAQTFGLGTAPVVDEVRIRWPNAARTVQVLSAVAVDQVLVVREPCEGATDPTNLRVDKSGPDLRLSWDDPGAAGWTWNVYRDASPDPSGWGPAHATGVTDEDPLAPGIQWTEAGGLSGGSWYYRVTAVNVCGETP
jgi:hypothetical protein